MTVLLREAIGDRLRHARTNKRRTLREVSRTARVSLGYLSEVERGRKEASSELLAAICDALELPLSDLLHNVALDIDSLSTVGTTVPARMDTVPAPAEAGEREERDPTASASVDGGELVEPLLGDTLSDLRIQPALRHRIDGSIADSRSGGVLVA
ncbi:transcriptional regulator with XRE-family HTH domain [Herbihabitans rhizosphaerae]|uniref:Transcriptional regulator with XRE-family HTH domain n=1 Tax=Herbihabitans rhizosphaerae TaxID=1872711 RepID=A0A4Q7KHL0_9PSEU|nr:helix-turn-helix transcriptional regulator [Herbihabitans rhizosphaerae]RZS34773.1 transcriptional regulator with XRE-family HTH domain [Herbihabitans rhizosphaerae]